VAFEADRPLAGGVRVDLDGYDRVLVGRGRERSVDTFREHGGSTLVLRVPGAAMSATHAEIVREGSAWTVRDRRSTNGTFVNGRAISAERLAPGDVLEMGHTFLVFMGAVTTPEASAAIVDLPTTPAPPAVATLVPSLACDLESLGRWAVSRLPLLVLGETGTGKELVARAIHQLSERRGKLVAVNCAALPSTLVESLLFGHVRGAFSGAVRDERGFVRSADGGTLFLDEVGDLPLAAQGTLLRVLQEGEVVPVGASEGVRVDARFVAATHRDLAAMAVAGTFRADLLARLDGATLRLPPLRDRLADLGVLAATLLRRIAGQRAESIRFEPSAVLAMALHAWPGNVRELERCLGRAVASSSGVVGPEHLPSNVAANLERTRSVPPGRPASEPPHLRDALVRQLRQNKGNVAAVARFFGKAPVQVHRWMRRFAVDPNAYRDRLDVPDDGE
jgi:transcriptional regulator with PAS, ATPase and Fis domain